jgi:hypothetical protein
MRVLRMPWLLAAACVGCGDAGVIQPGDIRVYTAPKSAQSDPAAAAAAQQSEPAPEAAD